MRGASDRVLIYAHMGAEETRNKITIITRRRSDNAVLGGRQQGREVGFKIRDILLDIAHEGMGDNVEVLLYMAARAQLWKEHIGPDLEAGKCVLMDRWLSSTCAYQGWAGGFGVEKVIKIGTDSLERIWPDVTIVLDVDAETAASRMQRALDRMEQKGEAYHAKVREGFLKLPDIELSVKVVDARGTVEQVHRDVLKLIQEL